MAAKTWASPEDKRNDFLQMLEYYAQGYTLKRAINAVVPRLRYDAKKFSDAIVELGISAEFQSANSIRQVVIKAAQEAREFVEANQEAPFQEVDLNQLVLEEEADMEIGSGAEMNRELIQRQKNVIFYKVALTLGVFKNTSLSLEEAVRRAGMNNDIFYRYITTYPALATDYKQALEVRKAVLSMKVQHQKMELASNVIKTLLEQTVDYEVKEFGQDTTTEDMTTLDGKKIGQRTTTKERMKVKENKPSPATIKAAMEVIGFTQNKKEVIPEASVEIEIVSSEEVAEKRKALRARLKAMKENDPEFKD